MVKANLSNNLYTYGNSHEQQNQFTIAELEEEQVREFIRKCSVHNNDATV